MDKIDYLIDYLLKESGRENFNFENRDKKSLYRALVNVRNPNKISDDFLRNEDEYLQEELKKKKVTSVDEILTVENKYKKFNVKNGDKISLWQGDITTLKIDAIVNAANSQGLGCFLPNHICIDNQIHTFAGVRLRLECNEFMKKINYNLKTSHCFMTKGYNLPSKKVIHTVGPIVNGSLNENLKILLEKTYENCLNCAIENNLKTIAFPCISTGVFSFPKEEASRIAIKTVDNFISKNREKIKMVVFNLWSDEDVKIYERYI